MKKIGKITLLLFPIIISCILGAAHFLRLGYLPLSLIILLSPFMLFWKSKKVVWFFRIILILLAVEWLRATYDFVSYRIEFGIPYYRLTAILLSVSICSFLSPLAFRFKPLRDLYSTTSKDK